MKKNIHRWQQERVTITLTITIMIDDDDNVNSNEGSNNEKEIQRDSAVEDMRNLQRRDMEERVETRGGHDKELKDRERRQGLVRLRNKKEKYKTESITVPIIQKQARIQITQRCRESIWDMGMTT